MTMTCGWPAVAGCIVVCAKTAQAEALSATARTAWRRLALADPETGAVARFDVGNDNMVISWWVMEEFMLTPGHATLCRKSPHAGIGRIRR